LLDVHIVLEMLSRFIELKLILLFNYSPQSYSKLTRDMKLVLKLE